MNPSSHCRTGIFEEEFQYVRGDIDIHIATQNIILTFLSKWHLAWQCKYGSLSSLLVCMHWKSIGSFKDKSCLIGYVPELN